MPRALQIALLWIISLAWVANLVIAYLAPELTQPVVNAPFMIVAAILFRQLRRQRPEDRDDQSAGDVLDDARRVVGDLIAGERDPGSGDDS